MQNENRRFSPRQRMVTSSYEFFHNIDDQQLTVDYHTHDFYEIFFFVSGDVTYLVEGKSYKLRPGDIIIINNKELHRPLIEQGKVYERFVIWMNPDYLRSLSEEHTDLLLCFEENARVRYNLLRPSEEMLALLRKLLYKLENVYYKTNYGYDVLQKSIVMELFVCLNKAYLETNAEEIEGDIEYNDKISAVVSFINDNLAGDLSLNALSSEFYISKFHLLREFHKYTGFTIHQFIRQKRLIKAKAVLREGGSVKDAYIQSGFANYSNFSKSFKEEFGASPRGFMANERERMP